MTCKVSIIIPVYNAAAHLQHCMLSLYEQTLQDIEVIFADDCSTDNSAAVIKAFIDTHSLSGTWHIVRTTCNSGPGAARNAGLESAQGEFVAFCDADDYAEPDMYETLYNAAVQANADIAFCDAYKQQHNDTVRTRTLTNPDVRGTKRHLTRYVAYLWTYLFRRSLVSDLRFLPLRSSEDSVFIAEAVMLAKGLVHIARPLYHYIVYPASVSHTRWLRWREKHHAFNALFAFAKERDLLGRFLPQLIIIYIKKAMLTSLCDWLKFVTHA